MQCPTDGCMHVTLMRHLVCCCVCLRLSQAHCHIGNCSEALLLTVVTLKLPLQVCDVLVWPESAWLMSDGRSGVKLTALHVFLH